MARSQQALRKIALGEYEAALSELEAAQGFSRSALVTLNRDPARAQTVLDTCLYLVRVLAATGDQKGAATQAEECGRIVSSGAPTPQMHPPGVVDHYEEAAKPNARRASTLLVETDPPTCALRGNGVLVGDTPFQLTGLYPGRHQVQVGCDPGTLGRVLS